MSRPAVQHRVLEWWMACSGCVRWTIRGLLDGFILASSVLVDRGRSSGPVLKSATKFMRRVTMLVRTHIVVLGCLLSISCAVLSPVAAAKSKSDTLLRVCAVQGSTHTAKECAKLSAAKRSKATCIFASDRLSCLRLVSRRKADFTLLEAEDLVFSTNWDESAILVVSEMRSLKAQANQYGAVVVVRNALNLTRVEDLRGTKLCHPGMATDRMYTQYLEERVAAPNCADNLTTFEDRIKTTADFFGAACKAGPWVEDPIEDLRLKTAYRTLCALCDDPDECSKRDKYWGSGGAATCFKDGVGDVLWAKHAEVKRYLFKDDSESELDQELSFLCDDGSLMPISSKEPCLWLARPWQIVAANRKSATDVQKTLELLQDDELNEWEDSLVHVLEFYMKYIINLPISKTPEDYLRSVPGYLVASTMSEPTCRPAKSVVWCVTSVPEQRKCVWLAKAAQAFTISPQVHCDLRQSLNECLTAVANREADVVVVRPEDLPTAILQHHLQTLLQEEPQHDEQAYLLYPVVKQSSSIKKLADFKGRKVCLSEREGLAWNTALTVLGTCNLEEVFTSVCIPSMGQDACCHQRSGDREANVLRCLVEDVCDVAFVDINTLYKYTDGKSSESWARDARLSDFRSVCRGEKGSECHWAWSLQGHVMVSPDLPVVRQLEASNTLLQLSRTFGRPLRSSDLSDPAFEMFAPFFEDNNVLFQDSTISLVKQPSSEKPHGYEEVLRDVATCRGGSFNLHATAPLVLICTWLLFLR